LQALPVKGSAAAVERGREKKKKKKCSPAWSPAPLETKMVWACLPTHTVGLMSFVGSNWE
jgi:hypothetical protein